MSELTAGAAVWLSPLVRRILAPNPGIFTGPGTNTYLVGREDVAVIDPGPDDTPHLDTIAAAGLGRIRWILVSHTHVDHFPGAAGLKERTGAEVLGFTPNNEFVPDRVLGDDEVVIGSEFRLRNIHTPGHASDHLCYLLEEERMLFSGDHIMQGSTVVIAPPDGDMAAYLDSLGRLLDLELRSIAPGHGHVLENPRTVVQHYLAHRLDRERQVLAALGKGSTAIDAIVASLYQDVRPELHPIARYTVHAHLEKLAADGLVRDDGGGLRGRWELVEGSRARGLRAEAHGEAPLLRGRSGSLVAGVPRQEQA